MKMRNIQIARYVLLAIALAGLNGAARANPVEDFFKDRQLSLYVGGGPGGGVDIYARAFSRHIVNHLPGKPTVVARNLPAAGGIQAFTTLATTAPRDGSAFATSARGPLTDSLISGNKPNFDVLTFNWLGALNDESSMCHTMKESPIKTIEDAMKHEVTVASTGARSESAKIPLALNAAINTNFKVIIGYRGQGDLLLAVERNEVEGRCSTFGSLYATRPDWVRDDKINILVQVGLEKHPDFPNVPLALDLAKTPDDKGLLAFAMAPLTIASPFALPAEVPADRVAAWRAAFDSTVKDAAFLEEAKKLRLDITPKNGQQILAILRDIHATPPHIIKRAVEAFNRAPSEKK